mgnify:FL=1|jgi:flagellar biosynthesis anti-sigma factor FlgM
MKINEIQNKFINTNSYRIKESKKNDEEIGTDNIVKIQISDSAKALVNKINQSHDAVFSERVEKIRQAILDGNYIVSSEEIADKIIKVMEEQRGSDI